MKQETLTPKVLIAVGFALCVYALWGFWAVDLVEFLVTVTFGILVAGLGALELGWTKEFNETFYRE